MFQAICWEHEWVTIALTTIDCGSPKLLVELGADVNAADETGQTTLHAAAYKGVNAIIHFLVDKGAKLDVKDKFGQMPLSIAEGVSPASLESGDNRKYRPRVAHKSTADLLRKLGGPPR